VGDLAPVRRGGVVGGAQRLLLGQDVPQAELDAQAVSAGVHAAGDECHRADDAPVLEPRRGGGGLGRLDEGARSTGRNRPEVRRLLAMTRLMLAPSRAPSLPVPAMSGMAIGTGSVRARVMSITVPDWACAASGVARIPAAPVSSERRSRVTGEVSG
jgi:hypothetical protein